MERTRSDDTIEELLEDIVYINSQGPAGTNRGYRAVVELLYRWNVYDDNIWRESGSGPMMSIHGYVPDEFALARVAVEAERRGYEPEEYGFVADP